MGVPGPHCCIPQLTPLPYCCFLLQLLIRSRIPSRFLPACAPPLLLMALPGLVPLHYLLCLQGGWSRGWAAADTGHEIIRSTSRPPRAQTASAWPPYPHPRGLCLDGHSLFTDHRDGGFQGRVSFPTDCEHKGNWQMVPGHTLSRSTTSTESDTRQEVMPSCPSGHVRHVS